MAGEVVKGGGAYIDMKNVDFFIKDGFSKNGAVNLMAGYAQGISVLAVDGFTGIVPNGVLITFANHDTIYSVTSHTETSGNTTSITISPALTDAVVDNEVVHAGPNQLKIKVGEGNLTYTEKKMREYRKDRGKLDQVRDGEEDPMEVDFQFAWVYLKSPTGAITPTVEEALKQIGPAASWVSTGNECEPYAVDLVIYNGGNPLTCGSIVEPIEQITLRKYYYEEAPHDVKAGTVSSKGKCNSREAEIVRLAAA
jgi:hypothetical protein